MPRTYNGTAADRYAVGANSNFIWGGGSCVATFEKTADGVYHGICVCLNSGGTAVSSLELDNSNRMEFYNGTTSVHSGSLTALIASSKITIGMSKAVGTTIPRAHIYVHNNGGFSHGDFSGTIADPSGPGAGGFFQVGGFESTDFAQLYLDRLAVFPYAMSDLQFRQLVRGSWEQDRPILHVENPGTGRQKQTSMPDLSKERHPQTTVSSMVNSNQRGAPAMRYSSRWRRAV